VRWLGELASHGSELAARRINVVAIAADDVDDMAALQTRLPRLTLLSDAKLAGLTAWGVLYPGDEHPIPATFVVTADGTVRWRYLYQPAGDWPKFGDLDAATRTSK
jgi:peroxiredoxin